MPIESKSDLRIANAELAMRIAEMEAKLNQSRCHSGHETLPLTLWDCPECHAETRRERGEALELIKRTLYRHEGRGYVAIREDCPIEVPPWIMEFIDEA